MARDFLRLTFKSMVADRGESGIFRIQVHDFRGFQYGDPKTGQSEIVDDLFSDTGMVEFRFVRKKNGPRFSQAEINRAIQTLRVATQTPER